MAASIPAMHWRQPCCNSCRPLCRLPASLLASATFRSCCSATALAVGPSSDIHFEGGWPWAHTAGLPYLPPFLPACLLCCSLCFSAVSLLLVGAVTCQRIATESRGGCMGRGRESKSKAQLSPAMAAARKRPARIIRWGWERLKRRPQGTAVACAGAQGTQREGRKQIARKGVDTASSR